MTEKKTTTTTTTSERQQNDERLDKKYMSNRRDFLRERAHDNMRFSFCCRVAHNKLVPLSPDLTLCASEHLICRELTLWLLHWNRVFFFLFSIFYFLFSFAFEIEKTEIIVIAPWKQLGDNPCLRCVCVCVLVVDWVWFGLKLYVWNWIKFCFAVKWQGKQNTRRSLTDRDCMVLGAGERVWRVLYVHRVIASDCCCHSPFGAVYRFY